MNLEDHLGDIIRKARLMGNVPAGEAASAAGMTETELGALEDSGQVARPIDFPALAGRLGLEATKLARIANGWTPARPQLSRWRKLEVLTTTSEGMAVNCFLAWDEATGEAALFDTGWEAAPVLECLAANRLKLQHLFITHTHADHIAALGAIRQACPAVQVHSHSRNAPPGQQLHAQASFALGRLRIAFCETPGHAVDGVTYILTGWPENAPAVAIVGDAVFAGSIGRGNQSWDLARQKVREHILTLPADTLLCPGHGPLTTVAEEQANNPFFI